MPQQIINLTRLMAIRGIDQVLSTYPQNPYQLAFQDPNSRGKLLLYVLRRLHNSYVAIDAYQQPLLHNKNFQLSLGQQQQIEDLIHEGVRYMLPVNAIQQVYHPPDPYRLNNDPAQYIG
ncbi:hypothetical protein IQ260_11275 [Leptolyngbya cf. ectocarpi LEGE 11479]|uniref:Uncharacterized protein n=1 Tax=Leptolyngbya cf. ectocarpi LEGE 11479 TaxID=1828722 RepID=A0A928X5G6_LEPEC|nr:hypothetical protein [Leptolyngbya ectocarpi]MBE9067238.1 hypothetical protein [Leptolyngbya cf. ectocarpi LEGE 11479]